MPNKDTIPVVVSGAILLKRLCIQNALCRIPTAIDCGPLADPENGQVNVPSSTFRSTASYTCDSGFNLVGIQTRECQANEEWSDEAPTCERKFGKLT